MNGINNLTADRSWQQLQDITT